MWSLGDEIASAGKSLDDEEMVSYILVGLDIEFNSVVSVVLAWVKPIFVNELYAQLLSFESRQILLQGTNNSSANVVMRGHEGFIHGRGGGRSGTRGWGANNHGSHSGGRGGYSYNSNGGKRIPYQVCEKEGHMAKNYRYCFNENYEPERRTVAAVTHSYVVDTNWYTDTGATYHITGELEKLDVKNKYACVDQVHTVSGSGMNISHIRHSVIPTPSRNLTLKNILHIPEADKSLLFIHRFTTDNHASLEYFLNFFLVKDLDTRRMLLKGRCHHGLYPLSARFMKSMLLESLSRLLLGGIIG
jgi:hypothetical protein